jgi:phosphoglucan,water dikinase
MMYVGNQTACWAATLAEPFEYALAQGFNAFEWFPDKKPGAGWDESDLDARARQSIREQARDHGMRLSVHARWQANPLAPGGNVLLSKDVQLARDLGAVLLNIHLYQELGLETFVKAIVPLIQQTAEAGLQFAIENTPHHAPEDFNQLFCRLHEMNSIDTRHVGMCLDLGHANLCSATHNDYLAFMDRLGAEVPIIHLHLHENWGDSDSHLPLFTGPAARDDSGIRGVVSRLVARQFSGSAILEQWPQPPSLLDQSRDRFLQLWNSTGKVAVHQPKYPLAGVEKSGERPIAPVAEAGTDFTQELVAGNRRSRSWREKLEFAQGLLARAKPLVTTDQLIDLAIYLRFLGTGEITCEEDGRHFRPTHHARIAARIQQRLAALTTGANQFIVRKIYPWLPSSAADFQRPEPLTRIRDIAHRNDIDADLKKEIKTTLQNKLHRCAGPEDLQVSSMLLARITAPGANYSPAFVEQFRIFHEELKEFFNAQSLDRRLESLRPSVDAKSGELIAMFLKQKAGASPTEHLAGLHTLTALRESLFEHMLRDGAVEQLEPLLADTALEDFEFVLLSEIINDCEESEPVQAAAAQCDALVLALRNLDLSGIERLETQALHSELLKWGAMTTTASREEVLRLRASLQRCRRLAESFCIRIIGLFEERAKKLGRALGVDENAIRVFSEADLRAHPVFQMSKLVSALLLGIRKRLEAPPWDVLVGGRAVGKLKAVATLEELKSDSSEISVVILARAAGDEEIPKNVGAIILAHEMPHLSHLGVRARQAGTVFATCEDPGELERLRTLEGKNISLLASPESVTWGSAATATGSGSGQNDGGNPPRVPEARLVGENYWLTVENAETQTSGSKAAGMRRLAELSRREGAGFHVPRGLVIPFGVLESALSVVSGTEAQYRERIKQLDEVPESELASATGLIMELVQKALVPPGIAEEVGRRFGKESSLIVRSSSNCEDLQNFAGAGLYESVMNVRAVNVDSAIRTVWSSLWTERAVRSRREAGISQNQAHMAVLIQELLDPEMSFVLHTVNPVKNNESEVYAEIVIGLGETLVSGVEGSPYRLVCDKRSGKVTTLAFANFSQAAHPDSGGGLKSKTVDYSQIELSLKSEAREKVGKRLGSIGAFVERALKEPQDIEGAVVHDRVYLVQARPQARRAASS